MPYVNAHAGTDYIVSIQDPMAMNFKVVFISKQSNSTEHVIRIANDDIFEGTEYFRCNIVTIEFTEQAEQLFRPQEGVNNTFADVRIEDNDSKSRSAGYELACLIA